MTNPLLALQARLSQPAPKSPATPLPGAFRLLLPELRQAVASEGYLCPTPIQEESIPPLLDGRDLLGSAQTGTGKTAAFTLPILQRLSAGSEKPRPRRGHPRSLILAPTRELAAQIGESIRTYGRLLPLRHTVIFGGVNQTRQVESLNRAPEILVATPGRLLDLMQQGYIHLDQVEILVLDEVDRMLDMGFIHDIRRIVAKLPAQRQTIFLSATLPPSMEELAASLVRRPVRIHIAPEQPTVEAITQRMLYVGKQDKDPLLISLLNSSRIEKAVVFTQMKHVANKVVKKLSSAGIAGAALHGNKSQSARTRALDGFRRGEIRVLVATDVAARGLDVDGITHVINYDLPTEPETYVHRIGRTARAGSSGDAISFCTSEDRDNLRDIHKLLGKTVPAETGHAFHCEDTFRSLHSTPHSPVAPSPRRHPAPQPPLRSRNRRRRRPNGKT